MSLISLLKRNKYPIFTIILLTLSLFGGVYLVKQRQDIRDQAAAPWCAPKCGDTNDDGSPVTGGCCPGDWYWQSGDCSQTEGQAPNGYCTEQPYQPPSDDEDAECTIVYNLPARCFTVTNCAGKETQAFSKDYTGSAPNYDQGFCGTTENPESRQAVPDNGSHTYCASAPAGKCRQIDHHFGGVDQNNNTINAGGVCECKPPPAETPTDTPPPPPPEVTPTTPPPPTNTPVPTNTPPSIKQCDIACSSDSECQTGYCYFVDQWARDRCRNRSCQLENDCTCPGVTPTNTPVSTNTPIPTNTPVSTSTPTNTPTNTPIPTNTPTGTLTPTNTPTNTPIPTDAPANTPVTTNTPIPTDAPADNTPAPTNTPVYIAEGPTPTRIVLPVVGVDFPVKVLTIVGSIITLLGFLILL